MAKKYYTLVCRERDAANWFIQFGDYDRAVVSQERDDIKHEYPRGTQWKIVVSGVAQKDVDAAILALSNNS